MGKHLAISIGFLLGGKRICPRRRGHTGHFKPPTGNLPLGGNPLPYLRKRRRRKLGNHPGSLLARRDDKATIGHPDKQPSQIDRLYDFKKLVRSIVLQSSDGCRRVVERNPLIFEETAYRRLVESPVRQSEMIQIIIEYQGTVDI